MGKKRQSTEPTAQEEVDDKKAKQDDNGDATAECPVPVVDEKEEGQGDVLNKTDGELQISSPKSQTVTPGKKGKETPAKVADIVLKLVRSFPVRSENEVEVSQTFYSDALSLTLSEKNDIIISDAGKMRLRVFDMEGNMKTEVLSSDLPDCYPACVCCIPERREIIVSHCFAYHGLVLKATPDYANLSLGTTFKMEGARCWGIAYSPVQDQIVVAHEQYKKISRIDPKTWKPFSQFVTDGAPFYLALSADGSEVYVTASDENRVEVYDIFGKYLGHYGAMGSRKGNFTGIAGITVDDKGNCIVCDKGNHRIQMLTAEKKWRAMRPENKNELKSPTDVKIASTGELCVLANNNIYIYEMA